MRITLADSYMEVINALDTTSLGVLFRAICKKTIGEDPGIGVMTSIEVRLAFREFEKEFEANKKRAEAGRKGGKATFASSDASSDASSKTDKKADLLQAKPTDEEPIYTHTEDSTRVLNTTLLRSLDGTESSTRVLSSTSPKASDGSNNPVSTDKEVLDKWMEYIVRRHNIGKELTHEEASKAWAILLEKSNGDPAKAKSILQKSIDRIRTEPKKEPKPKNRTNNFFDFNERKPGDPDYKDLDAIARKEI